MFINGMCLGCPSLLFFFKDTATTEIYTYLHTLALHDALPICPFQVIGDPDVATGASVRTVTAVRRWHVMPQLRPQLVHRIGRDRVAGDLLLDPHRRRI